jgi:uncharacterized protein YodC (DUF2158 family)
VSTETEEKPFQVGDTVMLKSGGAAMTVMRHVSGEDAMVEGCPECVKCDWIDANGHHTREKFHPKQLVQAVKHTTYGVDGKIIDQRWITKEDSDFQLEVSSAQQAGSYLEYRQRANVTSPFVRLDKPWAG